jgi:hypothetical protein
MLWKNGLGANMETSKEIRSVDWETYYKDFPDRYLRRSAFDDEVEREIVNRVADHCCHPIGKQTIDALEIGGGINGSQMLNVPDVKCWSLDPNVDCPEWMEGAVDWNTEQKFDVIVCRGSFNYLLWHNVQQIPDMLKSNGVFLFNTFYQPRNGRRSYVNSVSGVSGCEVFSHRGTTILHTLEPDGEDYIIQHEITVRSVEDIVKMLGFKGLAFQFLGSNTLFVSYMKEGC